MPPNYVLIRPVLLSLQSRRFVQVLLWVVLTFIQTGERMWVCLSFVAAHILWPGPQTLPWTDQN